MKKKIIIMVFAVCLLTGCGAKIPKLSNGEEALVEFGDGTKYSVDEIWNEVKESYALDVVLSKIDKKILESEFEDKKEEADEYVSSYETSIKANYVSEGGKFDEKALNDALTQAGFNSLSDYLEQVRLSYYRNQATLSYAKGKVSDKEISKYYKDVAVGDIHCLQILVKPSSNSNDELKKAEDKAKKIIDDIKNDVKSGTSVTDAFKKYEKNDEVTFQDLDYFNKGEMEEAFENEAFKLKKGGYTTSPVKTSYGYHVILKVDEKDKEPLDNIKDDIKQKIAETNISEDSTLATSAMIELRKKHGVKFDDTELENAYNKYMNYLLNQKSSN